MSDKYFDVLELLADIAGDYGDNVYSVKNTVFGVIPFKNHINMSSEIGIGFVEVANWLIAESKKNFEESVGVR